MRSLNLRGSHVAFAAAKFSTFRDGLVFFVGAMQNHVGVTRSSTTALERLVRLQEGVQRARSAVRERVGRVLRPALGLTAV